MELTDFIKKPKFCPIWLHDEGDVLIEGSLMLSAHHFIFVSGKNSSKELLLEMLLSNIDDVQTRSSRYLKS